MKTIYMDHNATTPMRPEVVSAMQPYLGEKFGNPNSIHRYGRETRIAIENARDHAAALIGAADSDEIFFTSGGTESDNWALRGVISAAREVGATSSPRQSSTRRCSLPARPWKPKG